MAAPLVSLMESGWERRDNPRNGFSPKLTRNNTHEEAEEGGVEEVEVEEMVDAHAQPGPIIPLSQTMSE